MTIVLTITRLGFIPWFSGAAITILHVPVINYPARWFMGRFGCWLGFWAFKFNQAAVGPTGVCSILFREPYCFCSTSNAYCSYNIFVFKALQAINKTKTPFETRLCWDCCFLGSLTNTVFVIGALYATHYADLVAITEGAGYIAFLIMLLPQALLEAGASVVLSIAVVSLYDVSGRKKSKLEQEIE